MLDRVGQAMATVMCRSVVIKGHESLITESMLAAHHYGVEQAVLGSLANLLPRDDWPEYAQYMMSRTLMHGGRRSEEMEEAARTVADAGIPAEMSRACASSQAWAQQFSGALKLTDFDAMLDAILAEVCEKQMERTQ